MINGVQVGEARDNGQRFEVRRVVVKGSDVSVGYAHTETGARHIVRLAAVYHPDWRHLRVVDRRDAHAG